MYLLHRAPEAQRLQTLLQRVIDMPGAATVIWVGGGAGVGGEKLGGGLHTTPSLPSPDSNGHLQPPTTGPRDAPDLHPPPRDDASPLVFIKASKVWGDLQTCD